MAWTSPRTWVTGELVTASLFNAHVRDELAALLPVDQVEWDSWTPTLTNITLGNGTLTAVYTRIGNTVFAYVNLVFGSTTTIAAGCLFSVPATGVSYTAATNYVGVSNLVESGVGSIKGVIRLETTSLFRSVSLATTASFVTHTGLSNTSPFTWGTADTLMFTVVYETE